MPVKSWLKALRRALGAESSKPKGSLQARKRKSSHIWLRLEQLEDRLVPATALTTSSEALLQAYGQLPISFEANAGQTNAPVQYLAHGSGYALFLTSTSAVLSLQTPVAPAVPSSSTAAAPANGTGVALAMDLIGANPQAPVTGQDLLTGTSNYFIGNDPSQWHTNIANYGKVAYQDVYPGVNLVYYGNQTQLEYDFVVAPGADPGSIRFAVQGADNVSLDDQGNLVLATANGDVLEHAPVIYQEVDGARQAVAGQFVLSGQNEVGFQVGAYDASRPLTIDPVLSYSTYLGGNGEDYAQGIAVDGSGNAYVTGQTNSLNFPTTTGVIQSQFQGRIFNTFVTKLNSAGTALVYSTYIGGRESDGAVAVVADSFGNTYIAGTTSSRNFPTTTGAIQPSFPGGNSDGFVTKLNATGSALIYSTYLGGSAGGQVNGIAVDGVGDAFVTGTSPSTNFPTTAGAFQPSNISRPNSDAFVAKLNNAGTGLLYSTFLSLNAASTGAGISVDSSGNAYITGGANSTGFPTTPGAFQTKYNPNGGEAFVSKLNATGTALIYSTFIGGSNFNLADSIFVDTSGNAYIGGYTASTDFPTTNGAFQRNYAGGIYDGFITKLNATGTALIYSTYLGGSDLDTVSSITVDAAGDAYVVGGTDSTNFPTTVGAFQSSHATDAPGYDDAFVAKLNAGGTALVYASYLGGNSTDTATAITLDGNGNAYIVGYTSSTNFPTTASSFQPSYGSGPTDSFVTKLPFINTTTIVGAVAGGSPVSAVTYGVPVTLTATVTPTTGSDTLNGGTVDFMDGSTDLGSTSSEVTSGISAVFTLVTTPTKLPVLLANGGTHTITAVFSPASYFNGSTGTLLGGLVITPAPLTITAVANTKVYDSTTTAAAIPTVSGLIGNDTVTGLGEVYADRNAASSKPLSVSAYTVNDGNGGNNYTVTTALATTGVITPASLIITASVNTKTYDSTTSATAIPTISGLFGGDTVTGLAEVYSSIGTGVAKTLSVSHYTVNDGNVGKNYAVTTIAITKGLIFRALLTITASSATKVYDSSTGSAATPTVSGLFGGDTVTGIAEVYSDRNAGSNKTVSVSAYVINDGSNGNNYAVTTVKNTTGLISRLAFDDFRYYGDKNL